MMSFRQLSWLAIGIGIAIAADGSIGSAQTVPLCEPTLPREAAATTSRAVVLPDWGLTVTIPSNYRAMKRQDGAIEILHPDDFAIIQCVVRGGRGANGYYSERIQWVQPDPAQSLRDQAIWAAENGYVSLENLQRDESTIREYQTETLSGYIVRSTSEYGATFLGTVTGRPQLLKVTAGCDCPVNIEAVTNLLSRIRIAP